MGRSRHALDTTLLRDIPLGSWFMTLPSELEDAIGRLPRSAPHFDAALKFAWFVGAGEDHLHTSDANRLQWRREACLRAALSEFSLVENAVIADAKQFSIDPVPTALRSPNPAIHLFRELRNLELHLTPSRLTRAPRSFRYKHDDEEHSIDVDILVVEDLTLDRMKRLGNAKHYEPADLEAMVTWLNRQQDLWGVTEVFRVVVGWRASEIVRAFGSRIHTAGAG